MIEMKQQRLKISLVEYDENVKKMSHSHVWRTEDKNNVHVVDTDLEARRDLGKGNPGWNPGYYTRQEKREKQKKKKQSQSNKRIIVEVKEPKPREFSFSL